MVGAHADLEAVALVDEELLPLCRVEHLLQGGRGGEGPRVYVRRAVRASVVEGPAAFRFYSLLTN